MGDRSGERTKLLPLVKIAAFGLESSLRCFLAAVRRRKGRGLGGASPSCRPGRSIAGNRESRVRKLEEFSSDARAPFEPLASRLSNADGRPSFFLGATCYNRLGGAP